MTPLLSVRDLEVVFTDRRGQQTRAVDGVSLDVAPGQTIGLVGESGCGKSVTSLAILGLLAKNAKVSGTVEYDGRDLLALREDEMRRIRGREIAMVFQDPMTSLNPVLTIGRQISEVLQAQEGATPESARRRSVELLDMVGISDAGRRIRDYPHQLSGGMRQRAMIAMALACEPRLLIADEPTTALDVTIQAQIIEVLRALVVNSRTALVLITHDLGVVAGMCETVHVMYSGRIVESAARREIFHAARHPYTAGLLASVPRLDADRGTPLKPIAGSPRDTIPWEQGCAFTPRCPNRIAQCEEVPPRLVPDEGRPEHMLRCHNPVEPPKPKPVRRRRKAV